MQYDYDVIVIGAGPAGCTAAYTLVENEISVLLIEKFKLPRHKSCSGVLIKKSMDLIQTYYKEDVPVSVCCHPIDNRGMIFTNDNGREYRFEQEGRNVWRQQFDFWLMELAKKRGAEIRDNTIALSYERDCEKAIATLRSNGAEYTVTAKYIIDCEGAIASLKKKIPNMANYEYVTTYQTYNWGTVNLDYHYFYAYLQPRLSGYDAWFNVKDNYIILGVSMKDTSMIKEYYRNFIEYMEKRHSLCIDKQIHEEKWLMPLVEPRCNIEYGKERLLFAGEVAGFLNPMGEGISGALESGHLAALAICENINNPDNAIIDYKKGVENLKSYMCRQWDFVSGISSRFEYMKL